MLGTLIKLVGRHFMMQRSMGVLVVKTDLDSMLDESGFSAATEM